MRIEKSPIRSTTVTLAVVLLLLVQGMVLFCSPGSDPLLSGETVASWRDSFWFTAQARGWLYGYPVEAPSGYVYPLISLPYWAVYSFTGLSAKTASLPAGFAALGVTVLVLVISYRRFGPRSALFAGWILALEPFWNEQARRPHPYPWIALWVIFAIGLGAGRGRGRVTAGFALALLGAMFLHPLCGLALPSLSIDLARVWRSDEASNDVLDRGLGALVGAGVLVWFWWSSGATLSLQNFTGPLARLAPIATLWGLLGLVLGWLDPARRLADSGYDRSSASYLLFTICALGLSDVSPAAYAVLIPFLVHHATVMVERVVSWAEHGRAVVSHRRLTVACLAVAATGAIVCVPLAELGAHQTAFRVGAVIAVCGVGYTLALPFLPRNARLGWPSVFAVCLAGCVWAPTWLLAFGLPEHSHRSTSQQVASILLPTASISGRASAALGVDSQLPIAPTTASETSHWVTAADPSTVDTALEFVEVFHPLRHPVRLYRRTDDTTRSAFEDGVQLQRDGEFRKAQFQYLSVLKGFASTASAWARLGHVFQAQGEIAGAYQCFLHAIQEDPSCVAAHVALASLYIRDGYQSEAIEHLQRALDHEPRNESLRRFLAELRNAPR